MTPTCATSCAASSRSGVPGYHIEDQKPGAKKCGHQGGKVLVPSSEQVQRLNAARFQLDIMRVPGIIVARTDAEAANLIDGSGDERDQPFILGATNVSVPSYKTAFLAAVRQLNAEGVDEINGHLLHAISDLEYEEADAWLKSSGVAAEISSIASAYKNGEATAHEALDAAGDAFLAEWQTEAGLKTLAEAVADQIEFRRDEESAPDIAVEDWLAFASARVLVRDPRQAPASSALTWSGTPSWPRPRRATTRCRAASRTRSPSRSRPRRTPTCSGWRPRRPTWRTRRSSPTRSTPSTRTRCSPTTCRRPSTGTRRA